MALIQKDGNADLIALAAKSNPIAFFATDQAAQDAYDNGEIPEGTIVFTEEDAESNLWVDFTPYSTSGLTDVSAMRREEGGLVHYVIHARTSNSIGSGSYSQPDIRLYNVDSGFVFKSVLVGTGNENAGRPLAYTRGEPSATSNIGLVVTNTTGTAGYFWVTLDVWATA